MYLENKNGYKESILLKASMEKWEIIVESDNDKKLLSLLFDNIPIQQQKQKKHKSLESICFIIFGQPNLDDFLENGYKTYERYKPKKKKKQSK